MSAQELTKRLIGLPLFSENLDDFFRPWNPYSRMMNFPAVNISETKEGYQLALAAPGLTKEDFKINIDGSILTIGSEKEENYEEQDKKYSRKEYNFSSFSRSFTLPDEVNADKIAASYEGGVLKLALPRKVEAKTPFAKQIAIK